MSNKAPRGPRLPAILEFTRRFVASFRRSRSDEDLEQELRLHLELAAEAEANRAPIDADAMRRARLRAGGLSQALESCRDQRTLPSLDALRADVISGWRQLASHRVASLSAILSLGLAMGAAMAAFRLVDVVLLRPLPVADPSRLFVLTKTSVDTDNRIDTRDDFDYVTYRRYIALAGEQADLMVVGFAGRRSIVVGDGPENAVQQYVSGNVFATLGLRPALGRLLTPSDDVVPGGHPVAVISHEYWRQRFAGDPRVVGRTFRVGGRVTEIVGVAPAGFTGTEPGAITDFYLPSVMNAEALGNAGWTWFRLWVRPKPGIPSMSVQARLQADFHADHVKSAKEFPPETPQSKIDAFLSEQLLLQPASSGASGIQKTFRRPLWILATLAALLLLIACANVANLLLARAMSRRTEMALRLSIGASRGRLIQLMLVESALLGVFACAAGALFAWWSAPLVVSMLAPAERPIRLMLGMDWRTLGAGAALTLMVTMLFGLAPALRASAATPIGALKETRSHGGQRGLTDTLVAAQMALCVFLLVGASLFVGTFDQLKKRPLGFPTENLLVMPVESGRSLVRTVAEWTQLAAELRDTARVESAAVAGWAPLTGNRWRGAVIVSGRPPQTDSPNWVSVSPAYFETMGLRLVAGREFRVGDRPPASDDAGRPIGGVAIVNEAFARVYFDGRNPVGQRVIAKSSKAPIEIVGLVPDAVYFSVRETSHPAVYVPLEDRYGATILVRTSAAATDLRQILAREISRRRPDLQTREVVPFETLVTQQMLRERLLAALSTFFAVLALVLAVIGIYGVLTYAVTRERRNIGLRMALGARPGHVVVLVTTRLLGMTALGALGGIFGGIAFGQVVRTLLFKIEPNDPFALFVPLVALAAAATVAVLPPAIRAVGIDPAQTIKNEG